jgi:Domain of unknown function (DUF2383).
MKVTENKELLSDIEQLNEMLKGELSAVESYDKALEFVSDSSLTTSLRELRDSHAESVSTLRSAISEYGTPAESPGTWGGIAKFVVDAAHNLGDKALLAALEEGEDIGLNSYEWKLVHMHGPYRDLVKNELFPKQEATHKLLSKILSALNDGVWPPTPEMQEG